ncbi:MAG: glycosyltransferase family 4 protein, partial [bacterium]
MNKKLAIIVCAWPPNGGGIGNNAYYQAKEPSKRGFDVTAFTPVIKGKRYAVDTGYTFKPLKNWLGLGHAGFLLSLLWQLRNFDIAHLYYPFFGTDLVVILAKKIYPRLKLVVHYEMDAIGFGWQKYFFAVYSKLFLGLMVKACDKFFVLSEDHAKYCRLKPFFTKQHEKFVVVPNGIDENIFQPQEKDLLFNQYYNLGEKTKKIIFVGGLDKQHFFKGVDVLIRAVKNLSIKNDLALLVIGDGELKKQYKDLARQLGIEDRIIFLGWVKNEELPKYYSNCDVFVLPSTESTESFGIVIAEAQACGLPAVVSDWPGSRKTIKNEVTGLLCEPKNALDLAEKMNKILSYPHT